MRPSGPLHIKYRPNSFSEFLGNRSTIESLKSVLSRDKDLPHSILFQGPSGCGKTTLARILKTELECSDMDFSELNMSNTRGIDTIREISSNCRYSPINGKSKIYLLDEIQRVTGDGQNALLKVLEDTPLHVYFILCTTEPEKLIITIRNRCTTYQISPLVSPVLRKLLDWVCQEEKVKIGDEVLKEIVRVSNGSPRQALVLLDQIIDIPDDKTALQAITDNTISEVQVLEICKLLLKDKKDKWKEMSVLIKGVNAEPESVRYAVLGYLASTLLSQENDRIANMIRLLSDSFIYSGRAGMVVALYLVCKL